MLCTKTGLSAPSPLFYIFCLLARFAAFAPLFFFFFFFFFFSRAHLYTITVVCVCNFRSGDHFICQARSLRHFGR